MSIKCPLCSKAALMIFSTSPNYNYCPHCRTAWQKKIEKNIYSKFYYQPSSNLAKTFFEPFSLFFYFLRRKYLLRKKYASHLKTDVWVDIGTGDGKFLETVKFFRRIGVEKSKDGQDLINKDKIEVISEKDFLNSHQLKANVISFWHVLEHVQNPQDFLSAARRNLSLNGKIIIGCPNIDSLEFNFFKQNWFHLAPYHHLWHFSPKSLEILLMKANLKIEEIDYIAFEHHFPGLLQSFINTTSSSHNVLHQLIKRKENDLQIRYWDIISIIFWMSLGLPVVILFGIFASGLKKPGAIVIVASSKE